MFIQERVLAQHAARPLARNFQAEVVLQFSSMARSLSAVVSVVPRLGVCQNMLFAARRVKVQAERAVQHQEDTVLVAVALQKQRVASVNPHTFAELR